MLGSRALYHRGWKLVTYHPVGPLYGDGLSPNAPFDDDVWELYHVAEDLSETRDLAAEQPERVAEMVELWWHEAERNQVLPLDNRVLWVITNPKPHRRRDRQTFRYFPGGAQVPESVAVNVRNRSHAITAEVEVPDGAVPSGVLLALGSALGGWSFHLLDGRLRYVHNLYGKRRYMIESDVLVGPGAHTLSFSFEKDDTRGGPGTLLVDGVVVGEGILRSFTPAAFNGVGVGLTCGYEWGPAVGDGYQAPFPFNGIITHAVVEATGPILRDPLAEIAAIMSEQ
jgi:arylsulfatase